MTWVILFFFATHWFLSLFFHTAFLHRYASHQMFTMKKHVERVFYFLTWVTQGSSYLVPRAYAAMHRMHHEFSDTEDDPHSPHFFKDVVGMMLHTSKIYTAIVSGVRVPAEKFMHNLPTWETMDRIGNHLITRGLWIAAYTAFYLYFVVYQGVSAWWLLLLPVHFLMGPVQGAIVNWFGHKLGYQNFDNHDHSRNTSPIGLLLMGELFQNNHHKFPTSPTFAKRWFEIDVTYLILVVLAWLGIIEFVKQPAN
jgi:stearoyl-CoA desaturase (Delta-9 desaturase)